MDRDRMWPLVQSGCDSNTQLSAVFVFWWCWEMFISLKVCILDIVFW